MNENQPLFSILIAHYNHWNYFQDCYSSILNQTYQNYEIVIVDDCSNDGSYEKLEVLSKINPKISLYRNDQNKGVGYTKRKCIEVSKGKFCGFLDPDDALVTTALEDVIKVYEYNKKVGVVYSKMMLCDENLTPDKPFPRAKKIINNDPWFFNIDTNVAHFFSFKKEEYQKTSGIDVDLKSAVDQDLYLKLYEVTNFYFINKCLYNYRLHTVGVSQGNQKTAAKDFFKIVLRNTMERRNLQKINNQNISDLDNAGLYNEIVKKHNQFLSKLIRKIKKF